MSNIEYGFERMKLGVWDDGTIAGVYMPEAKIGARPDLTVVEYVRADVHRGAVEALRAIEDVLRDGGTRDTIAEVVRQFFEPDASRGQ